VPSPPPSDASWLPWVARVAWLSLPLPAGTPLAAALESRTGAVQTTASALLWLGWGVVVLALLAPRPVGLTALRVVAPAAVAAAGLAALDTGDHAALAALTLVPAALAFLPETGGWLVNGAAYGYERRHLLRAPGALLVGPVQLTWLALVASLVAGPLLLAAGTWVAGALAVVAGVPVAVVAGRALHSLTQRWAVLVPAGLVLRDHVVLLDPVLFRRGDIECLRPAPADTDALDLTARSPGVALELRLREPTPLVLVTAGERDGQQGRSSRLMFTPTRPGAVLADAAGRRIPVE
jgi:hypothetical protein